MRIQLDKKNNIKKVTYYCGVDILNFPIYITHYTRINNVDGFKKFKLN